MIGDVLRLVAGVGCGLVTGVLFAFSAGVMTALGRLPAGRGAAAMQAINVAIQNPLFLAVFAGTALASVGLVVAVPVTGGPATAVAGAAIYVVGVFGVTVVVNVPLNDALDADAGTWERYRVRWTRWNHLRTVAGAVALALLLV